MARYMSDLEWHTLIKRSEMNRCIAAIFAAEGKPVKFKRPDGRYEIVHPDICEGNPESQWRVTYLSPDKSLSGHFETRNAYEAFLEVIRYEGNTPC